MFERVVSLISSCKTLVTTLTKLAMVRLEINKVVTLVSLKLFKVIPQK